MKRRETRADATRYTTPAEAYQHLTGQQDSAEAARLRMLARVGLDRETGPAEATRQAMIERRERRGQ